RDGRVGHPSSNDDVGAVFEGSYDAGGAKVRVRRKHTLANLCQRLARIHINKRLARRQQLVQPRKEIVARHDGDLHAIGDTELLRKRLDGGTAAERVDAAGVGDDLDAALYARLEDVAEVNEEVGRIARFRFARALFLQDGHGDFGQIVHDQVVDRPAFDLTAWCGGIVAPEPAAVGDNRPLHLNNSRAITIR